MRGFLIRYALRVHISVTQSHCGGSYGEKDYAHAGTAPPTTLPIAVVAVVAAKGLQVSVHCFEIRRFSASIG